MKSALTPIPKLKFSEPCNNLPGRKGVITAEDIFTIAFMRAYLDQADQIHRRSKRSHFTFAREIPVNGYGIADLLVVAWEENSINKSQDTVDLLNSTQPCSRAFECKLTDWRKAMGQVTRYRFFSNQSIVVLPKDTCQKALPYLNTFRKIKVGLWSFSPSSGQIIPHHTPRQSAAISERYYVKAIDSVFIASKQSQPIP